LLTEHKTRSCQKLSLL